MNFYTLQWGLKYGAHYVNRLYGSLKKHYHKPFTLTCYTDQADPQFREEIQVADIKDLRKFNTDRVFTYEKLILMEKHETGVWLDLDILIHDDITCMADDPADFKMIWNHWNPYWFKSQKWYGKGVSCHVNSSFVKWNNPEWLIKFTNDNWEKIEWTYKSLDKYLFYQHARLDRLKYWDDGLVHNYNVGNHFATDRKATFKKLPGKVVIFNTSHKATNKGITDVLLELHEADFRVTYIWEGYDKHRQ